VRLHSESARIAAHWQELFGDASQAASSALRKPDLSLELQLANTIAPPAAIQPVYRDSQRILDVYQETAGDYKLHFTQGALVQLSVENGRSATGIVTPDLLRLGGLEDVTYTSLAPLLRRRAVFLTHAAAVGTGAGALLLVGPTHSGKTTTGLALVLAGWKHLASDVVVLSHATGDVLAYPTSGLLAARPPSFRLLPALRGLLREPNKATLPGGGKPIRLKADQWGKPLPVRAICFPALGPDDQCRLLPLPRAVALARLMEESIDRWDVAALPEHIEFLSKLVRQSRHFRLTLAPDIERLPGMLEGAL
ncbi:MAG TPA: hypothetical protein VE553_05085, partial [Candidatus Binatia bacterium]|nr:hypothetical protein [Candidatus Binatia bacterium]